MKLIVGLLALIGLAVVMVFLAAIGLFAYDEVKRKMSGDDLATPPPSAGKESTASA